MTTVQSGYRDDTEVAKLRYEELLSRWMASAASPSDVEQVHAERSARIAAGSVGILGVITLLVAAFLHLLVLQRPPEGLLFLILVATWASAWIAYRAAHRNAAVRARLVARAPDPTGDPWADLARLAALRPHASLHALTFAEERSSVSLPLIALSLLMPLSIHALLFTAFAVATGNAGSLGNYDIWILFCAAVVGHAHLALACFGRAFASNLASIPDDMLLSEAERRSRSAFWWTVGISAIPGGILYLLPPIFTALTGAIFCGAMFRRIAEKVFEERAKLGVAPAG